MDSVTSADGVRIAYDRTGEGPPLVLVVGAFGTRFTSATLAEHLADQFTVFSYDRRGRGDSEDTPAGVEPAVERELDDLSAVLRAAGDTPAVYGHSSGGALALEASAAGVQMGRLAVYEPPFRAPTEPGLAEKLSALLGAGDRDGAVRTFLLNMGQPPSTVNYLRSTPYWSGILELAHTLPVDVALCDRGSASTDWLGRVPVEVLALAGSESPDWAAEAVQTIAETAPHASLRILEGQDHAVDDDVLVPVLRQFFG